MNTAAPTIPADSATPSPAANTGPVPESWEGVRDDGDLQFEPIAIPEPEIQPPGFFEEAIRALFSFLGDLLSPVGALIAASWPVLQWVLLGALAAFVIYLIANTVGPLARKNRRSRKAEEEPVWQPTRTESLALLEDADRLAAEGRFDEATRLLLQRSVGHIADARPDWVEPSSTARELAALPSLSEAARQAFGTISERVERSLFALRSLDASDWEVARAAYADFALVRIGESP